MRGDSRGRGASRTHHDTTSGLQTHGEGGHVQQQLVLHLLAALTAEDSCLHSGAICNRLVRVDALAQLLAVEEVLQQLLYLGDTGGTPD